MTVKMLLFPLLVFACLGLGNAVPSAQSESAATSRRHGDLLLDSGNIEGAIQCYNRALEVDSHNAVAYVHRGIAKLKKGDLEGAIRDYRQAAKIAHHLAKAFGNLGAVLTAKRQYNEAIAQLAIAIRLDPLADARGSVRRQMRFCRAPL